MRAFQSAALAFGSCWLGQFAAQAMKFGGEPSLAACLMAAGAMGLIRAALPERAR